MSRHDEILRELREADPAAAGRMDGLELGPAEAALAAAILAEAGADDEVRAATAPSPWPGARRSRRGLLGLAGALAAAAAIAVVVVLALGGASRSQPAYGAELVRFAESTPLLLLEAPGWRVEDVYEAPGGPFRPRGSEGEGSMTFITGNPIPDESTRITEEGIQGKAPAAVRQRKVELSWRQGRSEFPTPVADPLRLPVLDTTALVNRTAGKIVVVPTTGSRRVFNLGRPGDREMAAIWREGDLVVELRAAVPDLAAFEARLDWVTRVDSQAWLDAMPAKVIKAADRDAAVRAMLKGIPLPEGFDPSLIPGAGLTTNGDQVQAAVAATVSCLWFRQWGAARLSGDTAAEAEAEEAMATYRRWPLWRDLDRDRRFPSELIAELVPAMPSGRFEWRKGKERPILPQAEAFGCARLGLPVLPWKQKRQSERGLRAGA